MNKLSLKNNLEGLSNHLESSLNSKRKYSAEDIFDIVSQEIKFALDSSKAMKKRVSKKGLTHVAKKFAPKYFYDKAGQFVNVEKIFLSMKPTDIKKQDERHYGEQITLNKLLKDLNRAYLKYFTQTGLIIGKLGSSYYETRLGGLILHKPEICLDRYFRDNIYSDYITYIPMADIIAPILKEVDKFLSSYNHYAKYEDLTEQVGLVFLTQLINFKTYKCFTEMDAPIEKESNVTDLSEIEYIMMLMIIITNFLSYCNPRNTDKNNKALRDLMLSWCKSCRTAHDVFKYSNKMSNNE